MRLEQAVHDLLPGRRTRTKRWLADAEKNPEDPCGQVDGDLGREQEPCAGTGEEEEVAATRVMEEEH